ncbi:MAG: hypothetical protein WBF71_09585 [Microthrixaceae bacterium]
MNQVAVVSFEQFFRDEYSALVALGAWLTGDWATGEDLAQEAQSATHCRWGKVLPAPRRRCGIREAQLCRCLG